MQLVIGVVCCALVSAGVGVGAGWLWRDGKALADNAEAAAKAQTIRVAQPLVTERIVTKYKDRIIQIEGKGIHVKEIIERTAPAADCKWPRYYRRLHDAAARGDVPPDTRIAGDETPELEAPATLATVDSNYRTCHANAEQLARLQEWVEAQRVVAR